MVKSTISGGERSRGGDERGGERSGDEADRSSFDEEVDRSSWNSGKEEVDKSSGNNGKEEVDRSSGNSGKEEVGENVRGADRSSGANRSRERSSGGWVGYFTHVSLLNKCCRGCHIRSLFLFKK